MCLEQHMNARRAKNEGFTKQLADAVSLVFMRIKSHWRVLVGTSFLLLTASACILRFLVGDTLSPLLLIPRVSIPERATFTLLPFHRSTKSDPREFVTVRQTCEPLGASPLNSLPINFDHPVFWTSCPVRTWLSANLLH